MTISLLTESVKLIFNLMLLIAGAWCVSEGGDLLGSKYDATIIGGFIIAWLNTLPEAIFFVTALGNEKPNFAVGAISGSVIVVCSIAVGCCVWIGAMSRKKGMMGGGLSGNAVISLYRGVRQQALLLLLSCVIPVLLLLFGFQFWLGCLGLMAYMAFMIWTIVSEKDVHEHDDDDDADEPVWKGVLYLVAGGLIIYSFSLPFIDCVVNIGQSLHIAPLALAFFFAPVASEAPEILESISLSRKGKTQNINIAFSNLVGGTISKTTLLTGILCLYGSSLDFSWVSPSYSISFLLVVLCAGAVGSFGLEATHHGNRGRMLIMLFVLCSIVQFVVAWWFGSQSGDELLEEILEN